MIAYASFLSIMLKRSVYGIMNDRLYETSACDRFYRFLVYIAVALPVLMVLLLVKTEGLAMMIFVRFVICFYLGFGLFYLSFCLQCKLNVISTDMLEEESLLHQPLIEQKIGN